MKVVVSGGAGFIGSHFVEEFVNRGFHVEVIDNLRTGFKKNIEKYNLKFHQISITDKVSIENILQDTDILINLAALISVPESIQKPYETVDINVLGLLNLLEAAKKNKVGKIIHASSAAIYGDNLKHPKTILMNPEPKTPYAITKLDGEFYLKMYAEEFGLNTNSLRFFNVFGPRQDPKSQYAAAIPIFVHNAINNLDIIIYGDGEQTRDFVFVKDVVKAGKLLEDFKGKGEVFNVATGKSVTINEITKTIIKITNSKSKIKYLDIRPGDIKFSSASIKETEDLLGFSPDFSLEQGLFETIQYFTGK